MTEDIQDGTIISHLIKHSSAIGNLKATVNTTQATMIEIKEELSKNNDQLNHQNSLLAEHIKGVQTNSKRLDLEQEARKESHSESHRLHESNSKRISSLEEGPNFRRRLLSLLSQSSATVTALGVLGGLAYTAAKAFEWVPK